jgi:hypothetical protein
MTQEGLFADPAEYALDTNVVVSFLGNSDSEHYPMDVFKPQWDFLEAAMKDGRVIAPRVVEAELEKWQQTVTQMKPWLDEHKYLFRDIESDEQLACAKQIVNAYPAYASSTNYLGDLEVMALAKARSLTVISLEQRATQHSDRRPKIPNICEEFGITWVNLAGFLRAEGFASS